MRVMTTFGNLIPKNFDKLKEETMKHWKKLIFE